jgi:hypothetical protein
VRWLHPIGKDLGAGMRWRESILVAEEDAAIRAARDEARTPEERAFMDDLLATRERNRRGTA